MQMILKLDCRLEVKIEEKEVERHCGTKKNMNADEMKLEKFNLKMLILAPTWTTLTIVGLIVGLANANNRLSRRWDYATN